MLSGAGAGGVELGIPEGGLTPVLLPACALAQGTWNSG